MHGILTKQLLFIGMPSSSQLRLNRHYAQIKYENTSGNNSGAIQRQLQA
jgi:hypothetical protein